MVLTAHPTTGRYFSLHAPSKQRHTSIRAPLLVSCVVIFTFFFVLGKRAELHVPALGDAPPSFQTTLSSTAQYVRAQKPVPACAVPFERARTFLIVFQSRSGSTAISGELKGHSQTHMNLLEYLDRRGVAVSNTTGALAETRAFFQEGIAKGLTPGFKIRSYHIIPEPEKWAALAAEFGTRIIWQYRKNVVKSAIGTYQKEQLGDETAISGIKVDNAVGDRCSMGVGCKFRIGNMRVFHDMLKKRIGYQNQIMKAVSILDGGRHCTLEVPYEDYLYYPKHTMDDVKRFLGLNKEHTAPDRIKATKDSLCEVVENFDELCTNFYGCATWQPYFDDFVNNCRCNKFSQGPIEFCSV